MSETKTCRCCGQPVIIMCEVDYCSALCRRGKCHHQ